MRARVLLPVSLLAAGSLLLGGCSLAGSEEATPPPSPSASTDAAKATGTVVLVTHGDFALPAELLTALEKDTGLTLKVRKIEDGLPNQLALTVEHPVGDVAFGIDNGAAPLTIEKGVFADYQAELPEGANRFRLDGEGRDRLTPVDHGAVCVNIDKTWFAQHDVEVPATLEDLTQPAYKDLTVLPSATESTPGLLFLLATMDQYGDDWQDYWTRLLANGAEVTKSWSDAYFGAFSAGGSGGKKPIVVSYDTSPAFTIDEKSGESTTAALLDTCIEQVEYAGVLSNAANPEAAELVVDWLVSPEVQAAMPDNMYMFPVAAGTKIPDAWAQHADEPSRVYTFKADELAEHRQEWLAQWRALVTK